MWGRKKTVANTNVLRMLTQFYTVHDTIRMLTQFYTVHDTIDITFGK